jgi:hypothetical protein
VGHRLLPSAGEAFGGGAGLVDVDVIGEPLDLAFADGRYVCGAGLELATATRHLARDAKHNERNFVAEIEKLLDLEAEPLESARNSLPDARADPER